MKTKWILWTGEVYSVEQINQWETHHIPSKVAEKIVSAVGASPSIKRILQSNQELVEVTERDLHQMIIDFILEQQQENPNELTLGRYHSIEYIAQFMFESMIWSSRIMNIINHPYPMDWALQGNNSMAGDVSTWQYFLWFRRRKTLTSRQEFLDLAHRYYSRAMKIRNIGEEITQVIEQASPLVEMVGVPFQQAVQLQQASRRRSLN